MSEVGRDTTKEGASERQKQLPESVACSECVEIIRSECSDLLNKTSFVSRFYAAEVHERHEPQRRDRAAHATWAKQHPLERQVEACT